MEQLDIFGQFIPTTKTKPSKVTPKPQKVALRYEASWCDFHGNWYCGKGISEAQARYHLVQDMREQGYPHPEFAYRSHKVRIESYTIKL